MTTDTSEVIDLCDSFTLADHGALSNLVIDLDNDESGLIELDTDDSVVELVNEDATASPATTQQGRRSIRKVEDNLMTQMKNRKMHNKIMSSMPQYKFGDCPICLYPLGHNPLASTKCGHVYCMKCIEQYLLFDQRCPTCRQNLRGKAAYHPLYLNK